MQRTVFGRLALGFRCLLLVLSFFGMPKSAISAGQVAFLDELGAPDEDDEATDYDDEDGVDGDSYEPGGSRDGAAIRRLRTTGIMLGLGRTEAWLTNALSVRLWQTTDNLLVFGVGNGNYKTELRISDYTYDITFRTRGAYGGWRHFVGHSVPLFVQAGGGIAQWNGTVETRGSDAARGSSSLKTEQDYSAMGIYGEGSVGFAGYWANGFSLEYVLMGIGKTIYATYQSDLEGSSERALNRGVEFPVWFGLLNVAVGYYF